MAKRKRTKGHVENIIYTILNRKKNSKQSTLSIDFNCCLFVYFFKMKAEINQNYYKEKQTSKEHDICLHQNLRLACIAVND
jgi:hypothetical protein